MSFAESRHARGYCRRVAQSVMPLDVENGTAEGLAEIWRLERRGEFEPSHLLRAARNRIWHAARGEQRDRLRCLEYARRRREAVSDPTLDARLDLRAALPGLTTKQLEAAWRHLWLGQDRNEMGAAMGLSPGTAACHYSHALSRLRARLRA